MILYDDLAIQTIHPVIPLIDWLANAIMLSFRRYKKPYGSFWTN